MISLTFSSTRSAGARSLVFLSLTMWLEPDCISTAYRLEGDNQDSSRTLGLHPRAANEACELYKISRLIRSS